MRRTLFIAAAALLAVGTAEAQTPEPMLVVPAATSATSATSATTATTKPAEGPGDSQPIQASMKLLQQMKVANEETLRKQEATLVQLDELQKAAEQIKIYTKRG